MSSPQPARQMGFLQVYPVVVLPMFLALIDQTIVATALPDIAAATGDLGNVSWVMLAYLISAAIAAPCYGSMGDWLGKRKMLRVALVISAMGSLICASATGLEQIIVGRVIQGLGGGGLMALSHALIADVVPARERARYQGYFSATGMVASTAGPVIGGLISHTVGWEGVFLAPLPVAVLSFILLYRLPESARAPGKYRFDLVGLLLLAGTVAPLLVGLDFLAGERAGMAAIGLVLVAIVCAFALFRYEKHAQAPVFSPALIADPTVWRCCAMAMCHGATLVAFLTFLPLHLRLVHGYDSVTAGLMLVPFSIGIGLGSMTTGLLISRTGRTAMFPAMGLSVAVIGFIALAWLSPMLDSIVLGGLFLVIAVCLGTVMAVVLISAQLASGPERVGAAAGQVQLSRSLGAALGTAVVGAVLMAALRHGGDGAGMLVNALRDGADATLARDSASLRTVQLGFGLAFSALAVFPAIGAMMAATLPLRRIK